MTEYHEYTLRDWRGQYAVLAPSGQIVYYDTSIIRAGLAQELLNHVPTGFRFTGNDRDMWTLRHPHAERDVYMNVPSARRDRRVLYRAVDEARSAIANIVT